MAAIYTTDNHLVALESNSPSIGEFMDLIQDFKKLQLKVNKKIKFSNKKNWINSNKRRK